MATFTIDNLKNTNNVNSQTLSPKPSPTLNTTVVGPVRQASRWTESISSNTPIIYGYTNKIAGLPLTMSFSRRLIGRGLFCISGYSYYKGAYGQSSGLETEFWLGANCEIANQHPKKFVRNPLTATAIRNGHFNIFTGKFDPGYPEKSGDYFFYAPNSLGRIIYKTGIGTSERQQNFLYGGQHPTVKHLGVVDRSAVESITPYL